MKNKNGDSAQDALSPDKIDQLGFQKSNPIAEHRRMLQAEVGEKTRKYGVFERVCGQT